MKKILYTIILLLIFMPSNLAFGADSNSWKEGFSKPTPFNFFPNVTRFWSDTYKGHFYTADSGEAAVVDANYTDEVWRNEGTVFTVESYSFCAGCPIPTICRPVYRFWSNSYKHHFYTISETEKSNILANMPEWQYEGIVYYADLVVAWGPQSIPLYRFWSDTYKGHFYTTNSAEKNNIIANMPEWQYEGVAYYVLSGPLEPS